MKRLLPLILSFALPAIASAFDHSHGVWNELVSKHVKSDGVDYKAFKGEHDKLKGYLKELSTVETSKINTWSGNEQLAFLINLYNAATIDLVLDNYPLKSFKDEVGGEKGPWKYSFIKTMGKTYTLDQIEHELIRKNYNEPRIHFAVNCASKGCPPLRNEAFTADKLNAQLAMQTMEFMDNRALNKVEGKTVTLSPIFDWFKEDFIKKSGSVEAFVAPYLKNDKIKKGAVKIKYSEYSWNLNEAS